MCCPFLSSFRRHLIISAINQLMCPHNNVLLLVLLPEILWCLPMLLSAVCYTVHLYVWLLYYLFLFTHTTSCFHPSIVILYSLLICYIFVILYGDLSQSTLVYKYSVLHLSVLHLYLHLIIDYKSVSPHL
jgi:hypothetical protein